MCGRFYITKWLQVLLLYLHFLWYIIGISPYNKGEMPLGQGGKVVYVQHGSVAQSCPTLYNPMDCNMPGFPDQHQLLELAQTHVHRVSDAIQPSQPLLSPSPSASHLFQNQGLHQWVSSLHQLAKVLGFHLQHQSFQWLFRIDSL